MAISPDTYEDLRQLGDGVDHIVLDEEAERSQAKLVFTDGSVSKLALLYANEAFAQTTIRATDMAPTRGHAKTAGEIKNVTIESLEVNPGHYHLGVLAAAMAVLKSYPNVIQVRIQPVVGSADTVRGVALHLLGWKEQEVVDGDNTVVSLVRNNALASAA